MQKSLEPSLKTGHVICILEGSAEEVIIKKLFESDKLIFKNGDVYDGCKLIRKFSRTRKGRKFAKENLEMDYGEKHINILRILDSEREIFCPGRVYEERIRAGEIQIFNILTRPEIEMLIIINEGHYSRFTNRRGGISTNAYCKIELNMKKVKSSKFISNYFSDLDVLINSISEYKRLHPRRDEYSIFDLLE